jgi:hypothetical protein
VRIAFLRWSDKSLPFKFLAGSMPGSEARWQIVVPTRLRRLLLPLPFAPRGPYGERLAPGAPGR